MVVMPELGCGIPTCNPILFPCLVALSRLSAGAAQAPTSGRRRGTSFAGTLSRGGSPATAPALAPPVPAGLPELPPQATASAGAGAWARAGASAGDSRSGQQDASPTPARLLPLLTPARLGTALLEVVSLIVDTYARVAGDASDAKEVERQHRDMERELERMAQELKSRSWSLNQRLKEDNQVSPALAHRGMRRSEVFHGRSTLRWL
jgi:hypothetical protein